jgi:hypothetical protein
MGREDLGLGGRKSGEARVRDIETIDSRLRSVVALRREARERGWPLPSIDTVDALLDERLLAHPAGNNPRAFLLETSA